MVDFNFRRLEVVMDPESGNPNEIEGVLDRSALRLGRKYSHRSKLLYKPSITTSQ
jgi:hypothetical protein